jgi:hypothetical protein
VNFTKASVLGFGTGFVAALVIARIRVPRSSFLISMDKKESLTKKEAAARINDLMEDRELLFDFMIHIDENPSQLLSQIKFKALTDPRWQEFLDWVRK